MFFKTRFLTAGKGRYRYGIRECEEPCDDGFEFAILV